MNKQCEKCKGDGELECCECGSMRDCPECRGEGIVFQCVSEWVIPKGHNSEKSFERIKADAIKCKKDADYLIEVNPRAKESYQDQLRITLKKLNNEAERLEE